MPVQGARRLPKFGWCLGLVGGGEWNQQPLVDLDVEHRDPPTRAAVLIETGRVLPILDGFDEIDPGRHQAALRQLNTTPDAPMVITSRVAEYRTAVCGTDVLTAAAVVELDELTLQDLAGYLPRTAAGHRAGLWDPVLDRMRVEPEAPGPAVLLRVLRNPLMVFLAHTVYSDTPGRDPTDLLDIHRFPTTSAVREHLLAAFIPAVYQADQPGSTRARWTADHAHRYLTYLAGHLRRVGTRDVAWWQLRDTIPRRHRILAFTVVDGLVIGIVGELANGLTNGLTNGVTYGVTATLASALLAALTVGPKGFRGRLRGKPRFLVGKFAITLGVGLVLGLVFGLAAGVEFAFSNGIAGGLTNGITGGLTAFMAGLVGLCSTGAQPTRTRLQIRGRARPIARRFRSGLVVGLAGGLSGGFVVGLTNGSTSGLAFGVAFGLTTALAAALAFGLEAPAHAADVVSVAESLARDRRNALRKMLAFGLAAGFVAWYGDGPAFGPAAAVVVGFISVRPTSAWTHWLVLVRGWLPLTGRLPWRVQAFLTDAYQRGVLRQTGAVYQFRHARLQDHLTAEPPACGCQKSVQVT